jgi:hypothetical protein
MSKVERNWQNMAGAMANYIANNMFEAHRGIAPLGNDLYAAFGNDGYTHDERAVSEVERLREFLNHAAVEQKAFATAEANDDGTWVLIFGPTGIDPGTLTDALWEAWHVACGCDQTDGDRALGFVFRGLQQSIADDVIAKHELATAT